MYDILYFGAGYNGEKHDIEQIQDVMKIPAKPRLMAIGPDGMKSKEQHYTGFHDFNITKHEFKGRTYLLAVNGDAPPVHIIEHAILTEGAQPI